jgi:hypothetical protein
VTDDNFKCYVLEAIDSATASISDEVGFQIRDTAELCSVLGIAAKGFQANASYPLEAADVRKLKAHYGLNFDDNKFEVWLRRRNSNDDLPYKLHTGRELAMMLAKTKPLAAFTEEMPIPHGETVIPEQEFEPHVRAGQVIKREHIELPDPDSLVTHGQRIGLRRVLYALPGEEWRFDAYLQLWETAKRTSWTATLEREEGTLLGYEAWQNDVHMKGWKGPAPKDP